MPKFVKLFLFVFIGIIMIFLADQVYAQVQANMEVNEMLDAAPYVEGKILVRYKDNDSSIFSTNNARVATGRQNLEVKINDRKWRKLEKFQEIAVNPEDMNAKLVELLLNSEVEDVQPDYIYDTTWTDVVDEALPDDYNPANHWYYSLSNVPELWQDLECPGPTSFPCGGDPDVTIAVIDTGLGAFDFDDTAGQTGATFVASPEYSGLNLYVNSGEIAGNNLDDDCNGVVDDVNGIDTYAYNVIGSSTCTGGIPDIVSADYYKAGVPSDSYGHGTYVTGLIASATNNASQSVSPAFNISIMPIAANIHFDRRFTTSSLIAAIDYAAFYGADVINMSLGGAYYDSFLDAAVQNAVDSDVIVVASAGNTGVDELTYPAAYDNVIGVASVDSDGDRSSYSTIGDHVDISAYVGSGASPGNATWQVSLSCFGICDDTSVDNGYSTRYGIGTSYAAPQVAAAAGYVKSLAPTYTTEDVITLLLEATVDVGPAGDDRETGVGVIDFEAIPELIAFYEASQPGTTPVYRFYNSDTTAHLYTIRESDRIALESDRFPQYTYEGARFRVFPDSSPEDSVPVYRFYNKDTQTHFYTAKKRDRDKVISDFPQFEYEGPRYFVYDESRVKTKPVYQFYNAGTQTHLYVVREQDKDKLISDFPQFSYEGVAYYSPDWID